MVISDAADDAYQAVFGAEKSGQVCIPEDILDGWDWYTGMTVNLDKLVLV